MRLRLLFPLRTVIITDAPALRAIELIQEEPGRFLQWGYEPRATAMHNAQCLAGMAFSSGPSGHRALHQAHKTGAAFADYGAHIIHGAANAMYLPKVIAFNAKNEEAATTLCGNRRLHEAGRKHRRGESAGC